MNAQLISRCDLTRPTNACSGARYANLIWVALADLVYINAPTDARRWASLSEVAIITMPKYIAFLRAINVGGHTVKMDYLRALFEALCFTNVETFIASGNVIFDSTSRATKTLEKKIEYHLQKNLGYEVAAFILYLAKETLSFM